MPLPSVTFSNVNQEAGSISSSTSFAQPNEETPTEKQQINQLLQKVECQQQQIEALQRQIEQLTAIIMPASNVSVMNQTVHDANDVISSTREDSSTDDYNKPGKVS